MAVAATWLDERAPTPPRRQTTQGHKVKGKVKDPLHFLHCACKGVVNKNNVKTCREGRKVDVLLGSNKEI